MNSARPVFMEEAIKEAMKRLLDGRVNEILGEQDFDIPVIEFGEYGCGYSVVPRIAVAACERTEKERLLLQDGYSLTVTFALPETPESERYCYAYAAAVDRALAEDAVLGGTANRVLLTGKKYVPPKTAHCGDGWELLLTLRVTAERSRYAG